MLAILAVYVVLQMALGLWVARRVRNEDDYLVAGRRLGPVLAISSMFATWFGAESLIGASGQAYREGVGAHSVEPFAYGLCLCLLGACFAARLWRAGITTLADLFAQRHGRSTATIAALLMVPTSLLWAAAQVRAFGHVLAVNSEGWLGEEAGIAIAALVVVVYTAAGGLLADVVTDLVQGIALVIGCAVLLVWAIAHLGGVEAAWSQAAALPPRVASEPLVGLDWLEAWAVPILGSVVAQEAISRSLACRSPQLARSAGLLGGALYILVGLIPVSLGLLGPLFVVELDDPEQLLPTIARDHMPPFVHVLFTGALVSALLSTVDSSLLAASSVLTRNVLVRHQAASPRARLWTARVTSMACGVVAWALAILVGSVRELVESASSFGSAGLFVVLVWSLTGKRGSARAANAALLAGIVTFAAGSWLEWPVPFLASLLAAGSGLVVGVLLDRRAPAP